MVLESFLQDLNKTNKNPLCGLSVLSEAGGEKQDIMKVVDNIIAEQSANYIALWDGLSLRQRLFLKAISKSQAKSIFSKDFISENELGTSGSVQKSITLLKKKNVIDVEGKDILFNDIFFKKWIKNKML